jgi:hypothetical protein
MSGKSYKPRPVIVAPSSSGLIWSETEMLEIVSTVKWFRSFSDSSERSFFSDEPIEDKVSISSLGLSIAGGLLETKRLHSKIWLYRSLQSKKHSWIIMPTGLNLGLWHNVGKDSYVPRVR